MIGLSRSAVGLLVLASAVATVAMPAPAQAWWRGGGIGFGFIAPPVYIAPPAYYAPPPVYYAPPAYYAPAPVAAPARFSTSCEAGPYICPMEVATPAGAPCTCPGNYGRIAGRAR